MLEKLKEVNQLWLLIAAVATGVCGAMAYFAPMSALAEFRDEYAYDRAVQARRELRREVSDCVTLQQQRSQDGQQLTPFEQERCDEAMSEYDAVQQTIDQRWGK